MKNDLNLIISIMRKFTFDDSNIKDEESKEEIGEQGAAPAASGGGTKAPYPTVTKWASGRKFGPTYNPEQKVWASGLTRGKANTLL